MSASNQIDIFGNSAKAYPTVAGGLKFTGASILAFKSVIGNETIDRNFLGNTTQDGSNPIAGSYVGMIIQNYQLQYQQNITKLRGLNTNYVFNVVAPPTGQITLATALVDDTDYYLFCKQYGDACYTRNNYMYIAAQTQACGEDKLLEQFKGTSGYGNNAVLPQLALKGCLISQLQIAQNVQDLVMTSNLMLEFVSLNSEDQKMWEDSATRTQTAYGTLAGDVPNFNQTTNGTTQAGDTTPLTPPGQVLV